MIDLKTLRDNPDLIRNSQKARGENVDLVDQLIEADDLRRTAINDFEALRAEQNVLSKSVGLAKGDEKTKLLENAKELAGKVKAADRRHLFRYRCLRQLNRLCRTRQDDLLLFR